MAQSPPDPLPPPPPGFDPISEEQIAPMGAALGLTLTLWQEGRSRVEMPVAGVALNRQGVIHGGALATLLDTAAGYAGAYCPYPGRRRNALTLQFSVQYLAAVNDGVVTADAHVTGGGRSLFFAEATARDGSGRALAAATGVFKYRSGSGSLWGVARGG